MNNPQTRSEEDELSAAISLSMAGLNLIHDIPMDDEAAAIAMSLGVDPFTEKPSADPASTTTLLNTIAALFNQPGILKTSSVTMGNLLSIICKRSEHDRQAVLSVLLSHFRTILDKRAFESLHATVVIYNSLINLPDSDPNAFKPALQIILEIVAFLLDSQCSNWMSALGVSMHAICKTLFPCKDIEFKFPEEHEKWLKISVDILRKYPLNSFVICPFFYVEFTLLRHCNMFYFSLLTLPGRTPSHLYLISLKE